MGKNVGSVDRILRVIVGAVLIALVFVGPQNSLGLDRPHPDRDGADRLVPRLPPAWDPDLFGRKEFLTEVSLSEQRLVIVPPTLCEGIARLGVCDGRERCIGALHFACSLPR